MPPGIGAAAAALTLVAGRAAGRAGPGATSGGLADRPASPLRGATGARAGGSLATTGAANGDGGTTFGVVGGGTTGALGLGVAAGWAVGAGLGGGGGASGAGAGAGGGTGAGSASGGGGSAGGSAAAAGPAVSGPLEADPSEPAASLAASVDRAPLHSRNALHDSQNVASPGFSWPQFVQTITPIPHPAAGAGPLSTMNGPRTVRRRTRKATFFRGSAMLVRLARRLRKADNPRLRLTCARLVEAASRFSDQAPGFHARPNSWSQPVPDRHAGRPGQGPGAGRLGTEPPARP